MSGDLEDFLRRAAKRRQAKVAAEQEAASRQPVRRERPQYSDRRTERTVRTVEPEEILTADIIDESDQSIAARKRRIEKAKQVAAKTEAEAAKRLKRAGQPTAASSGVAPALTGVPAKDLIRMLQRPGGIQQAILIREVLDRPLHRWD